MALLIAVALPKLASAQAIVGTVGGSNQAVVFPSPNTGLPAPTQINVPALPDGAFPHGVSYFGSDSALVSDFGASRVFVVQISTASLVSTIMTDPDYDGTGTIAVAPGLTAALASGTASSVAVIAAPFGAGSTITTVPLTGSVAGFQTQAIVFNAAGRAFVYQSAGISVLDPPYSSVAFTIPVASGNGAIAMTPDGNNLLVTNFTGEVRIFTAPYSTVSVPVDLSIPGGFGLDGIFASPDGTKVLVVSASSASLFAISAPYGANSTVESIPLTGGPYGSFEDVGISADGQLAILVGNGGGGNAHTPFVRAPFTTAGATVFDVLIPGGRGNGAVRFLPPGLAPGLTISKSAPASVASGANLTYTITYGNTGSAQASNVVIKDPVPAGTTFVSATAGGTFSAGVVTWNIGTVNAGVTGQTVSFTVHVNAQGGTVDNVNYTIAGTGIPPIPGAPVSTSIGEGEGCPTVTLSPTSLPDGTVDIAYSQTITASGGASPYTFAVTSGAPPAGLTLSSGGLLSGTPTSSATFNFTITATDSNECTGSQAYALTISSSNCPLPPAPALSVDPTTVRLGHIVTLSWDGTIAAGQGSYTVQAAINGGGFFTVGTVPASGFSTETFDYRVSNPSNHEFRVLAVPVCNPKLFSASNTVQVIITGPCGQAPVVTGVTVTPTSAIPGATFTLNWDPAAGSASYGVFRSTDAGQTFQLLATTSNTSYTGTVTDPPGTTVTFEVEAQGCVYSSRSNFATLTVIPPGAPPACDPPAVVSNIQIQASGVQPPRTPAPTDYILGSWTPPATGTTPTRYGVRINGDLVEFSTTGNSVILPPRGSKLDPFQVFVTAYSCTPEKASAEVASDPVALFLTPPAASFTVSANPRAGAPLILTDTSSPQATVWLWIFDDDTLDTHQSPSHTFLVPGPHGVVLVASNGAGSSSTSQTIQVAAAGAARIAAASAIPIDSADPKRRRARVDLAGRDAVLLRIRTAESAETIVFLRFLDTAGDVVAERRLSVQPGAQAVYDLGAYGLKGAFSIELVSHQKFEPSLSVSGRPAVREIHR